MTAQPRDVRDARLVHLLRQSRYGLAQVGSVLGEPLTARSLAMLDGGGRLFAYLSSEADAVSRASRTASPALAQGVPAHGS